MAARAAAARRPVDLDEDVAELARHAVRPADQPAAGDDRAADPGRDGQVEEVGQIAGRPERPLGQRRDVGVPLERGRDAQRGADRTGQGRAAERSRQVRRLDERSRGRIERSRRRDPDAGDRIADGRWRLVPDPAQHADRGATTPCGPASTGVRASARATTRPGRRPRRARTRLAPRSQRKDGVDRWCPIGVAHRRDHERSPRPVRPRRDLGATRPCRSALDAWPAGCNHMTDAGAGRSAARRRPFRTHRRAAARAPVIAKEQSDASACRNQRLRADRPPVAQGAHRADPGRRGRRGQRPRRHVDERAAVQARLDVRRLPGHRRPHRRRADHRRPRGQGAQGEGSGRAAVGRPRRRHRPRVDRPLHRRREGARPHHRRREEGDHQRPGEGRGHHDRPRRERGQLRRRRPPDHQQRRAARRTASRPRPRSSTTCSASSAA